MACQNKQLFIVMFLFFIFLLEGCGLTGDLLDYKGDQGLREYAAQRDELFSEMKQYIGKSKDEVKKGLGEPGSVLHLVLSKGKEYEEEWTYKYDKGTSWLFPHEYSVSFYFNQGKVVLVDGW